MEIGKDWGPEGKDIKDPGVKVTLVEMRPGENFMDFAQRIGQTVEGKGRFGLLQNPDKPSEVAIITFEEKSQEKGKPPRGWEPSQRTLDAISGGGPLTPGGKANIQGPPGKK